MNCYIAELNETGRVEAVWVKSQNARAPRVYDPVKHIFDPTSRNEFCGAPKDDIVNWLTSKGLKR